MRSSTPRLWVVALLAAPFVQYGVLGQSATITSPPSPTITADPFRGYAVAETTTIPIYCPSGEIFTTSAGFAACCASTSTQCAFATACKDNAIVFKDGATSNCGPLRCQSLKIFPTFPADGSALIEPVCAGAGEVSTLFRAMPLTSKLVLPLTAVGSTAAIAAEAAATATSSGTTPAPTAPATAVAGSDASNASSSPNFIIAIVGAILGTMIFVALVLLALMYGRKRGNTKDSTEIKSQQPWKPSPDALASRQSSSEMEMKPRSASPYNPGVPPRPPPPPRQHIGMLPIPRSKFEDRTDWRSPVISRPLAPYT
ncbi:hypothetical protein F4820DRAFT_157821 [Hypoxylon rubiginosum]|uniref:Uncharacterized protein n=1 Tax=Hypoxylon rubiginosum TaxID=110542 RepID=A0ACB9YKS2_9PEZI|nr:hypothetical protein F4820DRAFT_157821 [Hypoxylon rubiginosum]